MAKIAFLCPGYGSQASGMGADFVGRFSWAADYFEEAKAVTGLDIFDLCMNQTQEELDQTQNGQPCIVVASLAVARALRERGIEPDCVAGLFEGEYAAHIIAKTVDENSALELVARRGALMAMAAHLNKGQLAVLEGCNAAKAAELCSSVHAQSGQTVAVSAYLDPETTAVSGQQEAVKNVCELWKQAGGTAYVLPGNVAANCMLMKSARSGMAMALKNTLFGPGEIPVYNNIDAKAFECVQSPAILGDQIIKPVMWRQTIEAMLDAGVDTFIQCGPGTMALEGARRTASAKGAKASFIKVASAQDVENFKL